MATQPRANDLPSHVLLIKFIEPGMNSLLVHRPHPIRKRLVAPIKVVPLSVTPVSTLYLAGQYLAGRVSAR